VTVHIKESSAMHVGKASQK